MREGGTKGIFTVLGGQPRAVQVSLLMGAPGKTHIPFGIKPASNPIPVLRWGAFEDLQTEI